ncbi:hypothetical protein KRX51_03220 [Corynebacterium sp. TAE3-ERU12]|uniref:hypothetical protein n=1 Tax=Corynebacterium sp. TAE3-ERU12 TaxID=2849491 RepID=UPI001C462E25|nr:hypothetical protein [Corynebacterium sp. TAE3-ERU12]MBV7294929.1 hypothetical protein [Corynebacterium sp. TAE3-ERU12]
MPIPAAPAGQLVAVQALTEATGEQVSTRLPAQPAEKFIVVSRIGGGASTFATSDPRFLIECYASDELLAEEFAEQVRAAWRDLRTHDVVRAYDDDNVVRQDDPNTDTRYRFQFTGGLKIRLR